MSSSIKVSIPNLFKWISTQYLLLEKRTIPYPCKLGNFSAKNNCIFVSVEFSGQINSIEIELPKLIEQNLFEYFSPEDKKKLFSTFHDKERFKLTDRYYCRDTKTEMVVLTDVLSGNKLTIAANLVSEDEVLLNKLSNRDVKRVAYMSALEFFKNVFK